jgi:hypothetical protein
MQQKGSDVITPLFHLVHFWSNFLHSSRQVGIEYTELGRIPFNREKEQNRRKALIHRNLSELLL